MAVSRVQGRLVAPNTIGLLFEFWTPSIWVKNSVFTFLVASFSLSLHAETIESISSTKIIECLLFLALLKILLTCFSESPTYLDIMSAELTEKNTALDSVAQALARNVFPVPGGPYNKTPFHSFLAPINIEGNLSGTRTDTINYSLAYSSPAMSSHLTLGLSYSIVPSVLSSSSSSSLSYAEALFLLSSLVLFVYFSA